MIEIDEFDVRQLAPGHRWRIGGDGTAINLRRHAVAGSTVHFGEARFSGDSQVSFDESVL